LLILPITLTPDAFLILLKAKVSASPTSMVEKTQKQKERERAEERKAKALRDNLRRRKTAVKNRDASS
jgi:hypothetical protein